MTFGFPQPMRDYAGRINGGLLIALFFFIPSHVAPVYSLTALMLVLSAIEGRFAEKWAALRQDSLFWIFQAFYWIFPLSLLWTDDLHAGLKMVGRYSFFLLSPLYLTIARREHTFRYISAFLTGVACAELLAYYNWLQMHAFPDWPAGIRVTREAEDTAPFVDHILYAPILAWAAYLAAHRSLFGARRLRPLFAILTLVTLGNLVFSGGRAGQLAFLILLVVLVFQRFARRPALAAIVSGVLVAGIAVGSYTGNDYLRARVDMAIDEATHHEEGFDTSTGRRLMFQTNSARLVAEHPLAGVGAGDFVAEYERINERYSPQWVTTTNPHNQYLFVLATTGVAGGLILLLVQFPPALWQRRQDGLNHLRVALAVFIAVVCLFEDYLWRSNTSLLFVLFAVVLLGRPHGDPQDRPWSAA